MEPRFSKRKLETFLQAIDRNLQEPFRIDLIGETVAILNFGGERETGDIDVTNSLNAILGDIEKAEAETGLKIPISNAGAGVYQAPYEYEGRKERLPIPGLTKLQVFAPEKHDWALMKVTRSLDKDIDDIIEVNQTVGLDKGVLLKRFIEEMNHVIGQPKTVIADFVVMMKELYGEDEGEKARDAIMDSYQWKSTLDDVYGT